MAFRFQRSGLTLTVQVFKDKLMEDDIIEFKCQVEQLAVSTELLFDFCVHFAFVRLVVAAVQHEEVVYFLVLGFS